MQPRTWLLISFSSWILACWARLVVPLAVPGPVSFAGSFSSPLTLGMGDPRAQSSDLLAFLSSLLYIYPQQALPSD